MTSQQVEISDLQTESGQTQQDLEAKALLLQEKDVEMSKLEQAIATHDKRESRVEDDHGPAQH